ncbi:MAG: hypothetical protein AAB895_00670, partial [Patescibacteria group bacterium]
SADILKELGLEEKDVPLSALVVNENEGRVLDALNEPKTKDAIADELGLSSAEANVIFSTLEIKGLIKESYGLVERIA